MINYCYDIQVLSPLSDQEKSSVIVSQDQLISGEDSGELDERLSHESMPDPPRNVKEEVRILMYNTTCSLLATSIMCSVIDG